MERGDGLVSSRQQGRIPKLPDSGIDHDSTDHGSKHNREGEGFKPQGRHVASSGKGPIFLLHERK